MRPNSSALLTATSRCETNIMLRKMPSGESAARQKQLVQAPNTPSAMKASSQIALSARAGELPIQK